jgi:SAM-dependent methyltransferase
VALAREGFSVEACDLHTVVLDKARDHAREEGVDLRLFEAAFADIPARAGRTYGAVLCLGNSLCMCPDAPALYEAVVAMGAVLDPGGVLVAHAVNYPALRASSTRFGPPRALDDGRLVLKLFDTRPGELAVNIVVLTPNEGGRWSLDHTSHPLLEVGLEAFEQAFWEAGLELTESFGSAKGEPYDEETSKDLFVLGRRK